VKLAGSEIFYEPPETLRGTAITFVLKLKKHPRGYRRSHGSAREMAGAAMSAYRIARRGTHSLVIFPSIPARDKACPNE